MGAEVQEKSKNTKDKVSGVKVKKLISIDGGWLKTIEGLVGDYRTASANTYILEAVREKMERDGLLK